MYQLLKPIPQEMFDIAVSLIHYWKYCKTSNVKKITIYLVKIQDMYLQHLWMLYIQNFSPPEPIKGFPKCESKNHGVTTVRLNAELLSFSHSNPCSSCQLLFLSIEFSAMLSKANSVSSCFKPSTDPFQIQLMESYQNSNILMSGNVLLDNMLLFMGQSH